MKAITTKLTPFTIEENPSIKEFDSRMFLQVDKIY